MLVAAAVWSAITLVNALTRSHGHGSVFATAIVLIGAVLAALLVTLYLVLRHPR